MSTPAYATDSYQTLLTAFHEAGHAVMAHLCGRRLTLVEIEGDSERRGSCTLLRKRPDPEESVDWHRADDPDDEMSLVEKTIPSVHLERELLCLCAGMVCELMLIDDESEPADLGLLHGRDLDQAVRLALQVVGRCDRVLPYLETVRSHAQELMRQQRPAVEHLAAALLEHRRLPGYQVHRLLARHIEA